jgi:TPR repeat protein
MKSIHWLLQSLFFGIVLLLSGCATSENSKTGTLNSTDKPFEGAVLVPVDSLTPFEKTKARAENGDAKAQSDLAWMYWTGHGVQEDYQKALEWYQKAAVQGNRDAQTVLGLMYQNGEGVAKDDVEAAKWYRKAANQGDAVAQGALGRMYEKGEGVAQDYVQAYVLYSLVAYQGKIPAPVVDQGRTNTVETNLFQSFRDNLARSMTTEQIALAQFNLGDVFYNAYQNGIEKNFMVAVNWLGLAADKGNVDAQYNLGVIYFNGNPPNSSEAYASKRP